MQFAYLAVSPTMNSLLALLSTLVVFAAIQTHAVHQPAAGEVYWNKVLPNTPIPTAIKELIAPSVTVSERGVSVQTSKPQLTPAFRRLPPSGETQVSERGVSDNIFIGGYGPPHSSETQVSERGVSDNIFVGGYGPPHSSEAQVSDYKDASYFFLEKDLQPGNKLTWQFSRTTPSGQTLFVSHEEANSVPFTSSKFPYILNHFSIQPNSEVAKIMYQTLKECERPASMESKYCATSLESMVEFSMVSIGTRNIQAVSTDVYVDKKENANSAKQQYTITSSSSSSPRVGLAKRLKFEGHVNNVVVCHALSYAYPVFYCHLIRETKAYQVSMVGEDGTKVETVAVCHMDTSKFDPKHISFQLLHVKPGTVPICHFLAQDSLVWEPKN